MNMYKHKTKMALIALLLVFAGCTEKTYILNRQDVNSNLTGIIPTHSVYDSTSGKVISASVDTEITLDTVTVTNDAYFSQDGNHIEILQDGNYTIDWRVSGVLGGGTRSGMVSRVHIDTGVGFSVLLGTDAYLYGRLITDESGSATGTISTPLNANDKVRLVAQGNTQPFKTVQYGSGITITKIG